MDEITKEQALGAYNLLMAYCGAQESCGNCLLALGKESVYGECLMELQSIPRGWAALDLD